MDQLPWIVWIWTFLIFTSILWYGFLLFYVGIRGASEIVQMTKNLHAKGIAADKAEALARGTSRE